jgi:hypothetical protein
VIQAGPAGFGNAATQLETHAVTGGTFTYGSYPDSRRVVRAAGGGVELPGFPYTAPFEEPALKAG